MEQHCSIEQQERQVLDMKEIFGDKLAMPLVGEYTSLPSPEQLKYKILIKGKRSEGDPDDKDEDDQVCEQSIFHL